MVGVRVGSGVLVIPSGVAVGASVCNTSKVACPTGLVGSGADGSKIASSGGLK